MKLEIAGLCKRINGNPILSEIVASIDFDVLGIVGPSGGGKSTLLRVIAGLLFPDAGTIHINGAKIPFEDPQALLQHRRSLGIVFQSWNLFPHLSALENIVLPLYRVHGFSVAQAQSVGEKLLDRFGLLSHASKRPHELSGGQCQRVAIVRAVAVIPKMTQNLAVGQSDSSRVSTISKEAGRNATPPLLPSSSPEASMSSDGQISSHFRYKTSLLLLDEPTSALDPLMTSEVLDLIAELKKEGICFILASHHMGFLQKIADQVAFIDRGKWIESGTVNDLFQNPRQFPVKDYLSKVLKY